MERKAERTILVSNSSVTPPKTKKIYLVRHGHSGGTEKITTLNPLLSELGVKQAYALKEHFSQQSIDKVITSSLERTIQTAKIITDVKHQELHQLNELHTAGNWMDIPQNKLTEIVNSRFYKAFDSIEFSESLFDFHKRIESIWAELVDYEFSNMLVVAHYEVMRAILSVIFKSPADETVDYLIPFAHTSVTEIRIVDTSQEEDLPDKITVVQKVNDTSHLLNKDISF